MQRSGGGELGVLGEENGRRSMLPSRSSRIDGEAGGNDGGHGSPPLVLHPARPARSWRLELHSSRQTSSCATAQSTTSMKSGSTASPSSSAPQGAPPCHPSRCSAPRAGNEAPGAYQPPPLQEDAMAPRRAAPRRYPFRQVPAQQERSCQEIPRPQGAARALPAPAPARQDPTLLPAAAHGDPQGQALPRPKPPVATAGCRAYTSELCSVAWPGKFKSDLPPHYDGTADPAEFL